ncbi:MAG: nucleotide exchange factor GrpE [Acutalibacteraceae bacterium]|nr:nucleotide exchange factor GrpE [Acutalibacteraceae bacterium]
MEREKSKVLIDVLKFYTDTVEGALSNCGVELLNPEVGMPMDQLRYAIARTVPTDDPELHSCIAEVKACGYAYNNKVLRPAKVDVYKSNHL